MDKAKIDDELHLVRMRIDQVVIAVSDDKSYRETAKKLIQVSVLLEECRQEIMNR